MALPRLNCWSTFPNPDPNPSPTPSPDANPNQVISVFLSIRRLGVSGALRVATGALGLATSAAAALVYLTRDAATTE